MSSRVLPRSFYDRDVMMVAHELLGKLVYRRSREGLCGGRIVETEAYLADGDTACHAARGRTRKNASMFGSPGRAYVYTIHARYCLNAVTESAGTASAVLIRAIEPIQGIERMGQRRRTMKLTDLCRGPARLCEALAIERRQDGWNLTSGKRLWFSEDPTFDSSPLIVACSPRIGVTSAHDLPLRFFVAGSPFVSGPKSAHGGHVPRDA